jgi:serralysin
MWCACSNNAGNAARSPSAGVGMAPVEDENIDAPALNVPCLAFCGRDGSPPYGNKALVDADLRWKKNTLLVQFLSGSTRLNNRVLTTAQEWSRHCGIVFQPTTEKGDIRIDYKANGHWSHLGSYAARINPNRQTMNLQFSDSVGSDELRRVVLHEFGHALGMVHEHKREDTGIVWNEEEVYRYYSGSPNYWSHDQITEQVLKPTKVARPIMSPYDPQSIMHYPVPRRLLKAGKEIGWNRDLTASDKKVIGQAYPKA